MNNIFKLRQLRQLIISDFCEIIREPGVLFWGLIFPMFMSLGLGAAFSTKHDVIRKVGIIKSTIDTFPVIDNFIRTMTTKEYHPNDGVTYFSYTIKNKKLGNTTFLFQETNWNDAVVALKRGRFYVVMTEKNNIVSYYFDPGNSDAQLTYTKLNQIFSSPQYITEENDENIQSLNMTGTRYIDFLIPGLIAMGIMTSCMWGIGYTLIERRSKKLMRRMVSTPMKKSYFLISIITVRVAMNLIEAALLFWFAYYAFDIRIQGNILALFTTFMAGNIAFSGLAIFVSCRTAKTEIGNALINVVVMPAMILSGIFFSYHNFPDWSIPIIQKFPLTVMADDIRSIFIEGAGFAATAGHSLILSITGVVFFIAGIKLFKWY